MKTEKSSVIKETDDVMPGEFERYLFHEGTLYKSYRMLGAHITAHQKQRGVRFVVWAPNALQVNVVGDFNNWKGENDPLERMDASGVWFGFIPDLKEGDLYKYEIHTPSGDLIQKADPYAFASETRPNTASIIHQLGGYEWQDVKWETNRKKRDHYHEPMVIYEMHAGSWKKKENGKFYTYRELADELISYVASLGYTHIQFMPLMEHPFDRSWGYQITGFYSVTSRYGSPEDFKYLVDQCHQAGLGVIMDWVPLHFCKDDPGLRQFDGTPLYEPRELDMAERPNWGTCNFDFNKPEVVSFLISNAMFWLEEYHIDGFRVDAVSSMIYLNHDNTLAVPVTNAYGGPENLEAIAFIKKLNEVIFAQYPHILMIAEEATDYPLVTSPTSAGGLGFNYKWNMGWANDVLRYMQMEETERSHHHHLLTFSFMYAFSENFVLPFSHDELVYGKRSLVNKMSGDYWQKFANLRVLCGYLMTHPGKKLLFMGSEFAQFDEWKDLKQLDWNLLDYDSHTEFHHYFKYLIHFYRSNRSLWRLDHKQEGFEWIDPHNSSGRVISFIRKGKRKGDYCIVVCNFSSTVYSNYRIGVPAAGVFQESFNSDAKEFGGSGQQNTGRLLVEKMPYHNQPYSMEVTVPPLGMVVFTKKPIQRKQKYRKG